MTMIQELILEGIRIAYQHGTSSRGDGTLVALLELLDGILTSVAYAKLRAAQYRGCETLAVKLETARLAARASLVGGRSRLCGEEGIDCAVIVPGKGLGVELMRRRSIGRGVGSVSMVGIGHVLH
jgi:hypothetical protein